MDPSLFRRLGGDLTVQAAANVLYRKLAAEPEVFAFFEDIDLGRQETKLVSFFTIILQGKAPAEYAPKKLRIAHAPLVERGLNDSHYETFLRLMQESLNELDVPFELVEEFMEIAESFRHDVLAK
jgi:hemoglobin